MAAELMDLFELDPKSKPSRLSRGKKSAFGITIGLAGRTQDDEEIAERVVRGLIAVA